MEQQHLTDPLLRANHDGAYHVEQVLKSATDEITELVSYPGSGGEPTGPFVRKRIARSARLGAVYERIFAAQREGRRFLHLPRIFEVRQNDRELIVVMEFVPGDPLSRALEEREHGLSLAERVFPAVCDAVVEFHEMFDPPIIHRDLKPSNIIVAGLDDEPIATLIDFSISRVHAPGAMSDTTHFGTLRFAPPEQFGCQQTDVRSDVYALGMILRLLLTWESCSSLGAAAEPDPSLDALPQLKAVVVQAAAFDPAERYTSVAKLRDAFGRACAACRAPSGEGLIARPDEIRARRHLPTSALSPVGSCPQASASPSQSASALPAPPFGEPVQIGRPQQGARKRQPVLAACGRRLTGGLRNAPAARAMRSPILGRIWNALIIVTVLLLCVASAALVVDPTGTAARMALSERIAVGIVVLVPNFMSVGYLLLDKRRLRLRISWLAGRTVGGDLALCAKIFGATMAVAVIAELFAKG